MNCRRGSVCLGHCVSQLIFNREGKVEGNRFFLILYQIRNNNCRCFLINIVIIVHLNTLILYSVVKYFNI